MRHVGPVRLVRRVRRPGRRGLPLRTGDCKLGILSLHALDAQRTPVPAQDVMADRQPESSSLPGGLGREEGRENLIEYIAWNPGPVVAEASFNVVTEVLRARHQNGDESGPQ